jgi:6-phosphogluconate dehydrogenase
MELGMVGLGRMGANMAERLLQDGHRVVGYDPRPEAVQRHASKGGVAAGTLRAVVEELAPPRAVWLMVPSGSPVDQAIDALLPDLAKSDVIIDGGNSYYKDSIRRAAPPIQRGPGGPRRPTASWPETDTNGFRYERAARDGSAI